MPSKASRTIGGAKINPVYLDKTSGLNKDQLNTINTILFNHYRRFRRQTSVTQSDEPLVLKNFESYSKVIQDVFDRSYGDSHCISFLLRVKDLQKDSQVEIGKLDVKVPQFMFQSGGSGTTNSETLPGYFMFKDDKLVFVHSAESHYNNYFRCYIFWQD